MKNEDEAVALTPIQMVKSSIKIIDYRLKYMPTTEIHYHCPPIFKHVDEIQQSAEDMFDKFGLEDFARIDGWLMNDNRIFFSDFNIIPGLSEEGDIFYSGSRIGLKHEDILEHIINHAVARNNKKYGKKIDCTTKPVKKVELPTKIRVLCGGATSERQISLMSGRNVWLKLQSIPAYDPKLYLLVSYAPPNIPKASEYQPIIRNSIF